jgi:putative transposase
LTGSKKNLDCSLDQKRRLVCSDQTSISVSRQCELLGIHRSGLSYEPRPVRPQTLLVMRLLDEQYTRTPFYGSRRMAAWLGTQGQTVNRKRVVGLMQRMGLAAIYPRPRLSTPAPGHRVYPYLLRGVSIERVDQVWSTDITYIRLPQGFLYLTAVIDWFSIDWFSRYVLSWEVSTTLDGAFCITALERALLGGQPEVFNTDQGSQFTHSSFHECRVHGLPAFGGRFDQYGWPGPCPGQHLRRASVAFGQVRRGVPEGICRRPGSH